MYRERQPWEWFALLAVLALAASLRFGWPGVNSFAFDEARLSLIALPMARAGEFATLGMPSSARVPNLPAAAWIYALPYAISPDPLVATLFTGLLSLIAVIMTWHLARRAWGLLPALVGATVMAASPYAVLYSRAIWAQDLLPVLGAIWLWAAFHAIRDRHQVALALHIFLAGFAFQVHFAGIALALASVWLFVRFRWWRRWPPVLGGAALAALAALPFALELLQNPALRDQFGAAFGGQAVIDLEAPGALVRLGLAHDWQFLALGDLAPEASPLPHIAAGLLLLAGLAVVIRKIAGGGPLTEGHLLAELTSTLLLATPLFFLRHSTPVFVHYQLVALPALALLAGASVCLLKQPLWRALAVATGIALAAVWTVQLSASLTQAGQVETPNGLGTPLGLLRDAAYGLPDDAPVLFFTHGDDPNVDGEAAIFKALWWERPHRIVRGDSLLILPDEPAYLMATLAPFQAWEALEAARLARAVMTFPRREGALPFVATRYDGQTLPDGFTPIEPVELADGVILEGWQVRWVGPRFRISTLWRVAGDPPVSGTRQQFHHLYPAEHSASEPLMIADVPISAHNWRTGDRLIVMADFFDVPPGEYTVRTGHYTLPDVARIPRADGGDSILLGPFTVTQP